MALQMDWNRNLFLFIPVKIHLVQSVYLTAAAEWTSKEMSHCTENSLKLMDIVHTVTTTMVLWTLILVSVLSAGLTIHRLYSLQIVSNPH